MATPITLPTNPDDLKLLDPIPVTDVNSWGSVGPREIVQSEPVFNVVVETNVVDNSNSNGPLSSLFQNGYISKSLAYPRDLDNFDKGHSIQFNIRDIKPFEVDVGKLKDVFKKMDPTKGDTWQRASSAAKAAGADILEKGKEFIDAPKETTGKLVDAVSDYYNSEEVSSLLNINPETISDKMTTIRLYMPDSLNFSSQAQYDKLSLADAVNSTPIIGKISTAITSAVNSSMAKMIGRKLGYTFNPQQQMLFEGIDFREFDLTFTFMPTSASEASTVKEIIRTLQRASAPTLGKSTGFYWIPPSIFDIGFFFNGMTSPYVPPTLQCVLQSVTVDYAPNGWAALSDGAPVQTTMTLSFKEIQLLHRDSIDSIYTKTNAFDFNIGGSVGSGYGGANRTSDNPAFDSTPLSSDNQAALEKWQEENRLRLAAEENYGQNPTYADYDIPINDTIREDE